MSSAWRTPDSTSSQPAVSSMSWPGVRIRVASTSSARASTSGDSTATSSPTALRSAPRSRTIARRAVVTAMIGAYRAKQGERGAQLIVWASIAASASERGAQLSVYSRSCGRARCRYRAGRSAQAVRGRDPGGRAQPAVRRSTRWGQYGPGGSCAGSITPTASTAPSCAWPDPEHRALAEFCENGAKAVAWEATRKQHRRRLLRRAFGRRPAHPHRSLARSQRPPERAVAPRGRRYPLPPDQLGRGAAAGRRPVAVAARPEPRLLLHQWPGQQRGRVHVPVAGSQTRHQQPARLLEHVPRIERSRVGPDHRRRQGHGDAEGHRRACRTDRDRRAESWHQPSAHAHAPRAGQAPRRPHRRDQPTARGRPRPGSAIRRTPAA